MIATCVLGLVACAAVALGTPAAAQANLLSNPGAEAGAASEQGWDSVTIRLEGGRRTADGRALRDPGLSGH